METASVDQAIPVILFMAQVVALAGLGIVAFARVRRDPKIGRPIYAHADSAGRKPVLFAVHLGLAIICLNARDFPSMHAVVALYGAFMLTWLSPGVGDVGFGEGGLYRGWVARRFEEFDEWELGREELRLRVGAQWLSIEVPKGKRGELRAALAKRVPERERPHSA